MQSKFYLFVVGDEILSGKREDKHVAQLTGLLARYGLEFFEVRFLGDDLKQIENAIRAVKKEGVLLCCGGIGATPDDVTRQAAAAAFDLPVELHPQAAQFIQTQFNGEASANRLRMAELPKNADLIPNPVNNIAGFSLNHCYFVPGFPAMAWPMLEWVMQEKLSAYHVAERSVEYRLKVIGTSGESELLELMESALKAYPRIKLSSLPFRGEAGLPRHIEFGFKGLPADAAAAYHLFASEIIKMPHITIEELARP